MRHYPQYQSTSRLNCYVGTFRLLKSICVKPPLHIVGIAAGSRPYRCAPVDSLRNDSVSVGGARRDRTADLLLAKQALSQLSYGPLACLFPAQLRWAVRSLSHLQPVNSFARVRPASLDRKYPARAQLELSRVSASLARSLTCTGPQLVKLVGLGRFELPTSPLSGVRSNQLSYRPSETLTTPGSFRSMIR